MWVIYVLNIANNVPDSIGSVPRFPFIPIGNGLNRRTLIYDKDVGRAATLAVSHPAAAGRVFNVTDGEFHTLNEIIESICSALGRKPPWFSLPMRPTRTLIGLIEKGSRTIGLKPPITLEMIDKYTEDVAVDGSLIQKELGFAPQYDLKSGWEETIRERREKLGGWEDGKVRRWEDGKLGSWEDGKIGGWEDRKLGRWNGKKK